MMIVFAFLVLALPAAAMVHEPCVFEELRLTSSDVDINDRFGWSVGLFGHTLVVGAPWSNEGPPGGSSCRSGSAYVFQRSGTDWVEQFELLAGDRQCGDKFGNAVAFDGDTIVVGAEGENFTRGAAYVFVRNGTNWTQQAKLVASDASPGDFFGDSMDVDGDRIVIGARENDGVALNQGSAYVFDRSGTTWSQSARLAASDGFILQYFGTGVAVDGDRLLIGARNALGPGAAYFFDLVGGTWIEVLKVVAQNSNVEFGAHVSMDGDTAAVSEHVYLRSGGVWNLDTVLSPQDPEGETYLHGNDVAVDGDTIVLESFGTPCGTAPQGAGFTFQRTGGLWNQGSVLLNSDAQDGDFFGSAVAIGGGHILMGAGAYDLVLSSEGVAYVFDAFVAPRTYCTGKTNSLGCAPFVSTVGLPSATSTESFGIRANDVLPSQIGFLLYGSAKSNLPFHGGRLCVKAPVTRLLPPQVSKATGVPPCTGLIKRDFNDRIQSGIDPLLTAGQVVTAQYRLRDPGDPFGFGDSLTDAVQFSVGP